MFLVNKKKKKISVVSWAAKSKAFGKNKVIQSKIEYAPRRLTNLRAKTYALESIISFLKYFWRSLWLVGTSFILDWDAGSLVMYFFFTEHAKEYVSRPRMKYVSNQEWSTYLIKNEVRWHVVRTWSRMKFFGMLFWLEKKRKKNIDHNQNIES